jgi:uncharacterized membrane protein YtjA (UPF0391 family)
MPQAGKLPANASARLFTRGQSGRFLTTATIDRRADFQHRPSERHAASALQSAGTWFAPPVAVTVLFAVPREHTSTLPEQKERCAMLDTSMSCLTAAMVLGFIELSRAASGIAPWLLFAFLITFLASLLMPLGRKRA